jgi:hypothetical protein
MELVEQRFAPSNGPRVDLHEDGLLWLINRCVFHPRGFALAHVPGTDNWELLGDGSEVWAFTNPVDEGCFEKVEACFNRVLNG